MKSLISCLTLVLIVGFLFAAGFLSAQRSTANLAQTFEPSATPIWATFPNSAITPYVTEAIYQPFEHGFMLWRADYNCVYAIVTDMQYEPPRAIIPLAIPSDTASMIHAYGYCLSVAPLTDRSLQTAPPAGLRVPTGVLGKIWRYYDEVRARLGYATAPEKHYTATIPTNNGAAVMDGLPFTWAQLTLPDGTIFACGSRAATAGMC